MRGLGRQVVPIQWHSHQMFVAGLGWDPAPYSLPPGSDIFVERAVGEDQVIVHWRKPDGQTGTWEATCATSAECQQMFLRQQMVLSTGASTALIDQPWVPFAVGALLVGGFGFWFWSRR